MTVKCKHNKEVQIHEEIVTAYIISVMDGKRQPGGIYDDGKGEATGKVNIYCMACKTWWVYSRFVSVAGFRRVPVWIKEMMEHAGIPFVIVKS